MSPFAEVQLVTSRELRKSFRSAKGVILTVLSIAGGAGISMLFAWVDRVRRENMPPGVDVHDAQRELFSHWYGPAVGERLAECPYALGIMLVATLWLGPLLVALLGFDAVSGELQHRSVRYFTVRARRSSYMIGKFLGAWIAVLAVTLSMNVIVWGAIASVSGLSLATTFGWGLRLFAVSVPISAAWCGIATLVGAQARTPMLSLLLILATFFGLWLVWVIANFRGIEWLSFVYPNVYDRFLLSPDPADVARGLAGTGLIAVATAVAGTLLFERRDV